MKNLANIIKNKFPGTYFNLSETFTTDEVGNIESIYILRIQDICSEEFNNFFKLEKFIRKLIGD